jgi:predicted membrane metal-binding protein
MANQLPIDIPDLENTRVYKAVVTEIPVRKGEILQTRVELINTQDSRILKSSNLRLQTTIWDKNFKITNLEKGDVIVFKGRIQNLPSAYNPKQFDYSSYLKRNGVFYQIFIKYQRMLINLKPIFLRSRTFYSQNLRALLVIIQRIK